MVSRCVCQSAPVCALVVPVCCERGLYLKNSSLFSLDQIELKSTTLSRSRGEWGGGDNAENYHLCGWFKARWYHLSAVLISLHQFEEYVLSALVLARTNYLFLSWSKEILNARKRILQQNCLARHWARDWR